jgi:hypothetical protein
VNILVSMLLSFFPERYWKRFTTYPTAGGAAISGIVEALLSVGLLVHRYFVFVNDQIAAISTSTFLRAAELRGKSAIMGSGSIFLIAYLLQPVTLLWIFLALVPRPLIQVIRIGTWSGACLTV